MSIAKPSGAPPVLKSNGGKKGNLVERPDFPEMGHWGSIGKGKLDIKTPNKGDNSKWSLTGKNKSGY